MLFLSTDVHQCFIDPSLRDMLDRILPLATYYTGIAAFVESRSHTDYGLVNHALCAAIRDMLKVGPNALSTSYACRFSSNRSDLGLPYPRVST